MEGECGRMELSNISLVNIELSNFVRGGLQSLSQMLMRQATLAVNDDAPMSFTSTR